MEDVPESLDTTMGMPALPRRRLTALSTYVLPGEAAEVDDTPPPPLDLHIDKTRRCIMYNRLYTLRHPVMREVLSAIIWGVPPACLGSR